MNSAQIINDIDPFIISDGKDGGTYKYSDGSSKFLTEKYLVVKY